MQFAKKPLTLLGFEKLPTGTYFSEDSINSVRKLQLKLTIFFSVISFLKTLM